MDVDGDVAMTATEDTIDAIEPETTQAQKLTTGDQHIFVNQFLFNHVIYTVIFNSLNAFQLLRLSRTCRLAYTTITHFIKQTWAIDRVLSRFFSDPLAFRQLQARTGTLISGSSALQFFSRTSWPESDLDLYLYDFGLVDLMRWLVEEEGYTFTPSQRQPETWLEAAKWGQSSQFPIVHDWEENMGAEDVLGDADHDEEDYLDHGIRTVFTLVKSNAEGGPDLKVQCIVARKAPMETILSFHSTCVMNVISYENAYCLYPRATLHENQTLICKAEDNPSLPTVIEKYQQRGFEFIAGKQRANREFSGAQKFYLSLPITQRYVGDPLCWTIPLDTDVLRVGPSPGPLPGPTISRRNPEETFTLPHDPVSTTSWAVKFKWGVLGTEKQYVVEMDFQVFKPRILRLPYIIVPRGVFASAVDTYLDGRRRKQYLTLDPESRWRLRELDDEFVAWCNQNYPVLRSMCWT